MDFNLLKVIIVLAIILGSVILHELAHGVVAYWLGDHTAKDAGRLTLNPIQHIDPFMSILVPVILYIIGAPVFGGAKPVPVNYRNLKWHAWGMALVAVAGPLTNFIIALIVFLVSWFTNIIHGAGGELLYFIARETIAINLGFMIFNLIPIPPLDGSRVLYAIAPDAIRSVMQNIERYGVIVVYVLIVLFGDLFSSLMVNGINGIYRFFLWMVGAS